MHVHGVKILEIQQAVSQVLTLRGIFLSIKHNLWFKVGLASCECAWVRMRAYTCVNVHLDECA